MSLPVVLRPEAGRDAEEARDYLEARRAGLGRTFLDRLDETLAQIGAMPEWYGIVWWNVRSARLRILNFVVYYRILNDRVEIIAVLHGSRDDSTWQSRA